MNCSSTRRLDRAADDEEGEACAARPRYRSGGGGALGERKVGKSLLPIHAGDPRIDQRSNN